MSLKIRFFTAFAILGLAILLVSSAGFYYFEYRQILKEQEKFKVSIFEKLRAVCKESQIEKNYIPAINFIKTLAEEKTIVTARCIDGSDRIYADTNPAMIGEFLRDSDLIADNPAKKIRRKIYNHGEITVLELKQKTNVGENPISIIMGCNETLLDQEAKKRLLYTINQILLISLMAIAPVIIIISFFLATALAKPVCLMEQASREFGAGNFSYSLEIPDTGDEISGLAKSLADMAHKLSELDNLKQRFFANITHDLRSPLAAVQGYADIMSNGMLGPVTEKQSDGLKIIMDSAHRLNNYIDDILDLAKLQSGSFELKIAEMSPENAIQSVADMFKAQTDKYDISLKIAIEDNLPKIKADEKLIHRCVSNFVSNAFKFTPREGAITIGADREAGFIRVYVKDTGPGIPKDKLEFVFDKFFQVAETKDYARKSGTGLGLTITKEIIQLHGGRVWVESELGKGATFVFTLPA